MKKYKQILGIAIFIVLTVNLSYAQDKSSNKKNDDRSVETKKETYKPYLFTGGSLWMGFGSYTYVDVNIVLGVQLTERINLGLSGKYQYLNDKRSIQGNFETSVYGGSIFSQVAIIEDFRNLIKVKGHSGIIAHIEYEFLNTEYNYIYFNVSDSNKDRYWLHNILLGGGYFQQMNKKAKSYIVILWNINQTPDNPYTYPQIRIGFSVAI